MDIRVCPDHYSALGNKGDCVFCRLTEHQDLSVKNKKEITALTAEVARLKSLTERWATEFCGEHKNCDFTGEACLLEAVNLTDEAEGRSQNPRRDVQGGGRLLLRAGESNVHRAWHSRVS